MITELSASALFKVLAQNWVLALVFALIIMLTGMLVGYLVGNTSLRSRVSGTIEVIEREKQIQKSVLDNVGLGIIVYDAVEAIYANETIFNLPGFPSGVPKTLEGFLETFDKGNQLKSNYILSCENGVNVIRVNYFVERKIYEIKIIKKKAGGDDKFFANQDFAIILVDDITQVKDDERRQKDLAANVSHELKTPLTSINNSVFSIIRSGEDHKMPDHTDLMLWAQRIQVNAIRMQDIVNDFLVLSQCSHTSVMGIFDLKTITDQAIANVGEYPGRSNVAFSLPEEGNYPLVYGNSKLIMRTIINLITNAIKYIDYEGKTVAHQIHVSIINVDDRIGVQVEDNGRGIPVKDIEHLFERFYRVDNSGSHDVGGSGIGLAIAKEIAEMHDGAISVTSTFGSGSTFTLSLPTGRTVFDEVYDDAKAGIISEKPLYRAAAFFVGLQECEAAKSLGMTDIAEDVEAFEAVEETEVVARDKALVNLIKAYGEERLKDLEDELLYTEDYFGDNGTEVPEEESAEVEAEEIIEAEVMGAKLREEEIRRLDGQPKQYECESAGNESHDDQGRDTEADSPENLSQSVADKLDAGEVSAVRTGTEPEDTGKTTLQSEAAQDAAADARPVYEDPDELEKRLAREEARKLLTQPVVQRAQNVAEPGRNAVEISKIKKEAHVIHPTGQGKRYNIKGGSAASGIESEGSTKVSQSEKDSVRDSESQPKSSLKQVLDGTRPLSE